MIRVAKVPILNRGEVLKIPLGKLIAFESSTPLFCLILTTTMTGVMFDYGDRSQLSTHVLNLYQRWRQKKLLCPHSGFPQYQSKNLTRRLAGIFDELN